MEEGRKEGKCREKKKEGKKKKCRKKKEGRKERREGGNISNRMKWHSNVFP